MAFWSASQNTPIHARAACQAAFGSQKQLRELHDKWTSEGRVTFDMRIGIHTGDAVNLASRLEGLNKQYSTAIMISEHTYQAANGVLARAIDLVSVKGKSEAVLAYELLAMDDSDSELAELVNLHKSAMEKYCKQDWSAALAIFEQVLKMRPDDPPASQLVKRCRQYQATPPESNWDGVFRMQTKSRNRHEINRRFLRNIPDSRKRSTVAVRLAAIC